MGWKYTGIVWKAKLQSPTHKLCLLYIGDKVNDDGEGCYASYDTMAMETGLHRVTVINAVKDLEKQGVLTLINKHPKYQTNVWRINEDKLERMPSKQEWLKQQRAKNPDYDIDEHTALGVAHDYPPDEGGSVGLLRGVAHDYPGGLSTTTPGGSPGLPNPSVLESSERIISMNNGAILKSHHPEPVDEPYDESNELVYGDDDDDPKQKAKARTKLERQICKLTNSKYISDAMRRQLALPVVAFVGKAEMTHDSPEDASRAHPQLFEEYVDFCANRIKYESGRYPSRQTLITSIRRYDRKHTGWFDYKAKAEKAALPGKDMKQAHPNGTSGSSFWFET